MNLNIKSYIKSRIFVISPYIGVIVGLYLFSNAFLAILIYHVGMFLSLFFLKSDYNTREIFRVKNKGFLIVTILVCALSGILLFFVWDYIKPVGFNLYNTMVNVQLTGPNKIIFLVYFSTIHPFLEESYWRFHLKPTGRFFSPDDLFFAGYHTLVLRLFLKGWVVILCFVALFFVAALWRYLREKKGETLVILLSHAVADFSIMLAVFLLY